MALHTLTAAPPRLTLHADTAADLMSPNPVSIRRDASVAEATALLTDRGFSAAPVIDGAGRPVGVVSRSDLLVHERENTHRADGKPDPTTVEDVMMPAIFSILPEALAGQVVAEMLALNVHRLFVVDPGGTLIGVITATDILRQLRP